MQSDKRAKDIMVGIFDFPHIPYWFSISQAVKIIKVSFRGKKAYTPDPLAVLVFDEKYNLMGILTLKDILRGLQPNFLKPSKQDEVSEGDLSPLSLVWDTLLDQESKALGEKPVSELIRPARFFVEPDEPITKAAYLMIRNDLVLLPVLEDQRKLIGLVRMIELFDTISDETLRE